MGGSSDKFRLLISGIRGRECIKRNLAMGLIERRKVVDHEYWLIIKLKDVV